MQILPGRRRNLSPCVVPVRGPCPAQAPDDGGGKTTPSHLPQKKEDRHVESSKKDGVKQDPLTPICREIHNRSEKVEVRRHLT